MNRFFINLRHAKTRYVVPEGCRRKSSQEDSFRLLESYARWQLGLLFFVELLDFVDHLETVLLWHLEVEKH